MAVVGFRGKMGAGVGEGRGGCGIGADARGGGADARTTGETTYQVFLVSLLFLGVEIIRRLRQMLKQLWLLSFLDLLLSRHVPRVVTHEKIKIS
jgi:hypothetical protein